MIRHVHSLADLAGIRAALTTDLVGEDVPRPIIDDIVRAVNEAVTDRGVPSRIRWAVVPFPSARFVEVSVDSVDDRRPLTDELRRVIVDDAMDIAPIEKRIGGFTIRLRRRLPDAVGSTGAGEAS